MGKDYTVTKAFVSTDKDTKQPQIVTTKAGNCHKYMVQVAGQPIPGWMQILKKITDGTSTPVKEGDVLYGNVVENNWGKPDFKKEQRPDGSYSAPQQSSAAPSQAAPSAGLEAKVDRILSLLETFLGQAASPTRAQADSTPDYQDVDDGPVDFSEVPY